jgi:hypothetical protein
MPKDHVARIARIHSACSTMAELHEQTRLLYESITAEARRVRAASRALKYSKKAAPRYRG